MSYWVESKLPSKGSDAYADWHTKTVSFNTRRLIRSGSRQALGEQESDQALQIDCPHRRSRPARAELDSSTLPADEYVTLQA